MPNVVPSLTPLLKRSLMSGLKPLMPPAIEEIGEWIFGDESPSSRATDIDFSPDGSLVAISHLGDTGYMVFNTSDGTAIPGAALPASPGHSGHSIAFSPNGAYLAIGTQGDDHLFVIDTNTWLPLSGIPAIPGTRVATVAFNPDGTYLAVGHNSGSFLTVLNTNDWSVVSGVSSSLSPMVLRFSPDGTRLALRADSGDRFRVLNTSDWSVVSGTPTFSSALRDISYSPDGSQLAIASVLDVAGTGRLTVYDTADWSIVPDTPNLTHSNIIAQFSPGGKYLVVTGAQIQVDGTWYRNLWVIDTSDWSVLITDKIYDYGVEYNVGFNPNGTLLGIASDTAPDNYALTIFNLASVISGPLPY